ncbi:hypothetical protein QQP08_016719 [Theobroma cacao]|nr:hypothetical protein QQP08_016719 [Theobroma cacao]
MTFDPTRFDVFLGMLGPDNKKSSALNCCLFSELSSFILVIDINIFNTSSKKEWTYLHPWGH